jgi:hypothetical protein
MLNYSSPYYRQKVIEEIQVGLATGQARVVFLKPRTNVVVEVQYRHAMNSTIMSAHGPNLHRAIENLADGMINSLRQRLRL